MSIGNQLKKARQKKQVTIEEVYHKTKIHPSVIAAIEEDSFQKILNPAYIRSFLKEYATYLELDASKIVDEYNQMEHHLPVKKPATAVADLKPQLSKVDAEKLLRVKKLVAAAAIVLLSLILLVKAATWVVKKVSHSLEASRNRRIAISAGKERAKVVNESAGAATAPTAPVPMTAKGITEPIPEDQQLALSIKADENVWVQLKVDGKVMFQGDIRKGSTETWYARENFLIWTGNAQVTNIYLNGNNLGNLGRGVKKDVLVTRKGIAKQ